MQKVFTDDKFHEKQNPNEQRKTNESNTIRNLCVELIRTENDNVIVSMHSNCLYDSHISTVINNSK